MLRAGKWGLGVVKKLALLSIKKFFAWVSLEKRGIFHLKLALIGFVWVCFGFVFFVGIRRVNCGKFLSFQELESAVNF